eukprot:TRINITY_DN36336_c0_g1_i1.p1 TRINITY_DN36336_c0_g1~~TRINITY_DN36336_c0_g1_i1.p1  ORF type:complete len:227 (+),score=52.65 TRINITY_DN36336_c0_g1_i1:85-765(+)
MADAALTAAADAAALAVDAAAAAERCVRDALAERRSAVGQAGAAAGALLAAAVAAGQELGPGPGAAVAVAVAAAFATGAVQLQMEAEELHERKRLDMMRLLGGTLGRVQPYRRPDPRTITAGVRRGGGRQAEAAVRQYIEGAVRVAGHAERLLDLHRLHNPAFTYGGVLRRDPSLGSSSYTYPSQSVSPPPRPRAAASPPRPRRGPLPQSPHRALLRQPPRIPAPP